MRRPRSGRVTPALLIALLAGEAVALLMLAVVAISSLVYAWNLQSRMFDVAKGLVAIVLAAHVGYAIYRTAKAAYRRNFQFSLRALLLAVAVVALLLGTLGQQVQRCHRLRRVLNSGATFLHGPTDKPMRMRRGGWLESRLGFDPLRSITAVEVRTDQALLDMAAHAEYFPDLEVLVLCTPMITDAGLAGADRLGQLPRLHRVALVDCTALTDSGFARLCRWSHVESLTIRRSNDTSSDCMTAAALRHLEEMKQLKKLVLVNMLANEEGLERLERALPNCRTKLERTPME